MNRLLPRKSSATARQSMVPTFDLPLQATLFPRAKGSAVPTYTNATVRFMTDFEGLLKPVLSGEFRPQGARRGHNLLTPVSNGDFSGWTGIDTPSGSTSGSTITFTTLGNDWRYSTTIQVVINRVYTVSFEIQRGTKTGNIRVVDGSGNSAFGATIALPVASTRYSYTVTATGTGNATIGFDNRAVVGGDGIAGTILCTSFQIEDVTGQTNQNPSEYVSVGVLSAPFHGAGVDGVKYFTTLLNGTPINSAAAECAGGVTAGVVDANGPLGYLAEGARTNRCLHSQVFGNAAWVSGGGGIAVATNSTTAPDGTTTADTLTASGANGTLIQDLGVVASAAKTGAIWLKRLTGTGNIDLTLDGGTGYTTQTLTANWKRFPITQTVADEDFGIRIVTSGDAVYAWQGQVVTAGFASSDIVTTTAAVTRNIDVEQYVSSGNLGTNNITITGESAFPVIPTAADYFLFGSYVDSSNYTAVLWDGTNLIARKRIAGTNTDATVALSPTANTVFKWAARFSTGTGIDIFLNGVIGTNHTNVATCQIGTNFQVGADGNGANASFTTNRNIKTFTRPLSAVQVGKL